VFVDPCEVAAKRLGASMACWWTVQIWDNVVHGWMTWMRVSGSPFGATGIIW